ncbi:MAG: hypothetical protein AAFX65_13850 [Cyanobacteria bacterium J06638_7]
MPTTRLQLEQLKPLQPLLLVVLDAATSRWRDYAHWNSSEGDGLLIDAQFRPYPEVRRLGEVLSDIGGLEAMQEAAYGLFCKTTDFDRACLSEINHAWAEIGDWQA